MPIAHGKMTIQFEDYGEEKSTVTVRTPQVATLTDTYDTRDALLEAAKSAIQGVSLGKVLVVDKGYAVTYPNPPGGAASSLAQRESKWYVRFRDVSNNDIGGFEIPCADLSLLDAEKRGFLDEDSSEWSALVSAIEAVMVSRGGNAIVLLDARHVGRNT